MRNKNIQKGFSLSELLTVIAVMAMLIGIGVPVTKAMLNSVNSSAGLRNMIAAAMSNARATAITKGQYAGVRFQTAPDGNQYMIFIVNDAAAPPTVAELTDDAKDTGTGLANGFRAVVGRRPIKLPGDGRVMDLKIRTNSDPTISGSTDIVVVAADSGDAAADALIDTDDELITATAAFSVIFSKAGKLVTHEVRVRNRHGQTKSGYLSTDKIFNIDTVVDDDDALLYQDDYPTDGLGQEYSRKSFVIYDKKKFDDTDKNSRWTNYLSLLDKIYLNPYTGELVGGLVNN